MKKTIVMIMLLAVIIAGSAVFAKTDVVANAADDGTLYVLNWGEYIGENVEKDFESWYEAETGNKITLKYSTADTNEMMITNLTKNNDKIDLVCPSEYAIERLLRAGLLQKIEKENISNIGNADPMFYQRVDNFIKGVKVDGNEVKMSDYFVPYMWGTLGVLYNTKIVSTEEAEKAGYGLLWNSIDKKELNGKILMKDSIRDSYLAAVLYLKEQNKLPEEFKNLSLQELANRTDKSLLDAAEKALKAQKNIRYEVDDGKGELQGGKTAYVGLAWSGDALAAMENNSDLAYYIPAIGANVWFDGWVIPKNAQNKKAALKFLEFMCRPDIAIRNSLNIGYTSGINPEVLKSNPEVKQLLEEEGYELEEYFSDLDRYPTITDNLVLMADFGDKQESVVAMWERVKESSRSSAKLWIILGSVAGGILLIVGIFFIVKSKKTSKGRAIVDNAETDSQDKNDNEEESDEEESDEEESDEEESDEEESDEEDSLERTKEKTEE